MPRKIKRPKRKSDSFRKMPSYNDAPELVKPYKGIDLAVAEKKPLPWYKKAMNWFRNG